MGSKLMQSCQVCMHDAFAYSMAVCIDMYVCLCSHDVDTHED
jgi:hypothetical protein